MGDFRETIEWLRTLGDAPGASDPGASDPGARWWEMPPGWWKTRDGRVLEVRQMDDEHLIYAALMVERVRGPWLAKYPERTRGVVGKYVELHAAIAERELGQRYVELRESRRP